MRKLITLLTAAALMPAAGLAKPVEEKNIISGKVKIEPDSGYIYSHGPNRAMGLFLKLPDAQEKADYEAEWAKAFEKEKQKYFKKLASWEQSAKAARTAKTKVPERPVEPTEANFSIGPIELLNPVSFGPQFIYSKSENSDRFAYLNKVKPGTYVYYGPIMVAQAAMGTCYCMGSVQFEVKAGTITDLGNFLSAIPRDDPAFPRDNSDPKGSNAGLYGVYFGKPAPQPELSFGLPESLKSYPSMPADFRASGMLENFYGITVSRMPPVPGVIAYDRGKIVDLKAQAEAPAAGQ
jgi:hypothetical protein